MHSIFKLAAVAAALGFAAGAFAQARTDVKINGEVSQEQVETEGRSRQLLDLGSVKGGGNRSSNVTVTGRISQLQYNTDDTLQALDIGNVEGTGSSNVTVREVVQYQGFSDNDAHQVLQIGSVLGNGNSNVNLNRVYQRQSFADKSQQELRIGVIK